jgi:F0F1-type ATP synthase epsilon subunit
MDALKVKILSLQQQRELTVEYVEVEAPNGGFSIFPHHAKIISLLKPQSQLTWKTLDGSTSTMHISGYGLLSLIDGLNAQIMLFSN